MHPTPAAARRLVGLSLAAVLAVTGCSAGEADDPDPGPGPTSSPTPADPSATPGPSLTPGGTELDPGDPATVLLRRGAEQAAVADVTVLSVVPGASTDLADFSLDGLAPSSTPWYARVRVADRGLGPLGGVAVPLTGIDAGGGRWPVTPLVGNLPTCPQNTLPPTFAPGSQTELCLLFLLPPQERLSSLVLTSSSLATPITWQLPATPPTTQPTAPPTAAPTTTPATPPSTTPTTTPTP